MKQGVTMTTTLKLLIVYQDQRREEPVLPTRVKARMKTSIGKRNQAMDKIGTQTMRTFRPDAILEDPYHQLSDAGNSKAKESDLEAHRR